MRCLNHTGRIFPLLRTDKQTDPVRSPRRVEGAFALLEVMVAVAILAIALLTFLASMANNVELTQMNSETNIALNALIEAKEGISSFTYNQINTDFIEPTFVATGEGRDGRTITLMNSANSNQVGRVTIQENDTGDLKTVELRVTWRSITGSDRTIRLLVECADH